MKHIIEPSGRMVPALDFSPALAAIPAAPVIDGLSLGTAPSGLPTVSRIHPVDGLPEGFGIFATPELAAHFHKTFGGRE